MVCVIKMSANEFKEAQDKLLVVVALAIIFLKPQNLAIRKVWFCDYLGWMKCFHSVVAALSFSYLIRASISNCVRSGAGFSTTVIGYHATERLSTLTSVTPCTGPSGVGLTISTAGVNVGFALSSAISSSIAHCAYCSPIKVAASRLMCCLELGMVVLLARKSLSYSLIRLVFCPIHSVTSEIRCCYSDAGK